MTDEQDIRLWLGWRAGHLVKQPDGWERFKKDLAETFIPITWQVMPRFGLTCYVPSIFSATPGAGSPEEVALLCYRTKQDYQRHRSEVVGRAYSTLHSAVFEFGTAAPGRISRSGWAGTPADGKPTLLAASAGGPTFADPSTTVHVVLLNIAAGQTPATQSLLAPLAGQTGSIALWCQPGFALIWIAGAAALDVQAICQDLAAAVPGGSLAAAHRATPAPAISEADGIPVADRTSWHFHR